MSYPYDSWEDIDWYLYDSFDDAKDANESARTAIDALTGNISEPVAQIEGNTIVYALRQLSICLDKFGGFDKSSWNYSYLYKSIYLAWLECDPLPPDPPTLIDFIEAYINADDDHRSAHRLLLDAYQSSMYDKPFDQEYHAQWVKRFRSWT